jgi:hypothetical protein
MSSPTPGSDLAPLNIGTRREPFFDGYLIDKLTRVSHELVDPTPTTVTFPFDEQWEGAYSLYVVVIKDGDLFRMYYRGQSAIKAPSFTCYAESRDGRNWVKPKLGLLPFENRYDNNIILVEDDPEVKITHNFTPFLDTNPHVDPSQKFKAIAGNDKHGLFGFASADGIHWSKFQDEAIFTAGIFDSKNVSFWSATESCYVLYFRVWTEGGYSGLRTIARTTSTDFKNWTKPETMSFAGVPQEEYYTNVTEPYPLAPHIYISLPSRFVQKRQWMSSPQAKQLGVQEGREADVSDVLFMTSRGGNAYNRHFSQAYLKPGLDPQDWVGRNNMIAQGMLQLDSTTLGFYVCRHYASDSCHLALQTLRTDGFARLRAGRQKGKVLTKPIVAHGQQLYLNFATSAAGTVRIDVLNTEGKAIEGFSGRAAAKLFGDSVHHPVKWSKKRNWSELAGRTIRLRFSLTEADLYALQQI